jgi:ABC-2 type transport system permease protein
MPTMFRLLLKKYSNESLLLFVACGFMLLLFPWVRIWTVSQFELSGFAPLIEQLRAFERFSPVPIEKYLTYSGVVGLTFDEPVLILCILVWSISRGSDLVSGELGRGTMEMLMAQPISRLQIVTAHMVVSVSGLAILVLLSYIGLYFGIMTNSVPVTETATLRLPMLPFEVTNPFLDSTKTFVPLSNYIQPSLYIPACLNLFGLGFFVLSLSVCMSSWDQYRWRTIGVVIGIYVLQILLFILGKATPGLAWVMAFSILAAYQPDWIIQRVNDDPSLGWSFIDSVSAGGYPIGPLGFTSILCGCGLALYLLGTFLFCKRDLPAPL